MVLTEATGDAELVIWDGTEFGYCVQHSIQIGSQIIMDFNQTM
jgi:hypothetical protein